MARAFSFFELLLALLIIGIVSSITLASLRVGGRQIRLELEAQRVAGQIRRAQALASAVKRFSACGYDINGKEIKPYGYGAYFDLASSRASFSLFADCDNDGGAPPRAGEEVEVVAFANDVEIETLSAAPLTIFFQPPQPTTRITGDAAEGSITLRLLSDSTVRKRITVRRSGEIGITTP